MPVCIVCLTASLPVSLPACSSLRSDVLMDGTAVPESQAFLQLLYSQGPDQAGNYNVDTYTELGQAFTTGAQVTLSQVTIRAYTDNPTSVLYMMLYVKRNDGTYAAIGDPIGISTQQGQNFYTVSPPAGTVWSLAASTTYMFGFSSDRSVGLYYACECLLSD